MNTTIFVANFDSSVEHDLEKLFSYYGHVLRVKIWEDLETGKSRGFGFVEMREELDALDAVSKLNGR